MILRVPQRLTLTTCRNDTDPNIGESTNEDSDVRVNPSTSNLQWSIPEITPNKANGSLEFSCRADQADEFFPIVITFEADRPLSGIEVADIVSSEQPGGSVPFSNEIAILGQFTVI